MKFKTIALAIVLSACVGAAAAQEPAAQPQQQPAEAQQQLTPEQQQQLARQDAELANAAQQVVQMIDANRVGDVWDLSTDVIKRLVPRGSFVEQVTADRNRLGAPAEREAFDRGDDRDVACGDPREHALALHRESSALVRIRAAHQFIKQNQRSI